MVQQGLGDNPTMVNMHPICLLFAVTHYILAMQCVIASDFFQSISMDLLIGAAKFHSAWIRNKPSNALDATSYDNEAYPYVDVYFILALNVNLGRKPLTSKSGTCVTQKEWWVHKISINMCHLDAVMQKHGMFIPSHQKEMELMKIAVREEQCCTLKRRSGFVVCNLPNAGEEIFCAEPPRLQELHRDFTLPSPAVFTSLACTVTWRASKKTCRRSIPGCFPWGIWKENFFPS